jgi:tRNA-splicing ligase RtcB
MSGSIPLRKISDLIWEVPTTATPQMRVPGRIYADEKLLQKMKGDRTLMQCANVATLPGIYSYSIALPDAHERRYKRP